MLGRTMEVIENLSRDLEKFDKIFLFSGSKSTKLLKAFLESDVLEKTTQRLLILSCTETPAFTYEKHEYRRISEEELTAIEQLYGLYDFSNRFQVIADASQYGGLLNYVKTGLMTTEEVFRAFLGK